MRSRESITRCKAGEESEEAQRSGEAAEAEAQRAREAAEAEAQRSRDLRLAELREARKLRELELKPEKEKALLAAKLKAAVREYQIKLASLGRHPPLDTASAFNPARNIRLMPPSNRRRLINLLIIWRKLLIVSICPKIIGYYYCRVSW